VIPSRFDDVCQFTNITSTTLDPPQEDPQTTTMMVEKQIEFAEAAPADISILSQPAPMDLTFVETLRGFLERPFPILTGVWTGDQARNTTINSVDPLKLYLNLPLIHGKLRGFSYLRAGLRIEIRLNGTRFHYGQLVGAFRPLDGTLQQYQASQQTVYAATMFPSVICDPGPSEVGILEVPYCYPQHFLSLTDNFTASIGTFKLQVLAPLSVVSSTNVPIINYTVYVSLVKPVLAGFTASNLTSPLRMLEEQSLDASHRVTPEANNMFATDINDVSFHTGIDSANSVARLPQYIGDFTSDMQLTRIFEKPNFETTFEWSDDRVPGYILKELGVAPWANDRVSYGNTYLSVLADMSAYWRGSIRYHVRIVASGFHSGRLVISWEPSFEDRLVTDMERTANRISMVIDIQETTDVFFTIPYMSRRPWLLNSSARQTPINNNGLLRFNVLNQLATPSVEPTSVHILVWKYGSSDLEFALPKVNKIGDAWPIDNAVVALEEQCLDLPLSDSRAGPLDGSFSVPGGMSMGEHISTVTDYLRKKTHFLSGSTGFQQLNASIYTALTPALGDAFSVLGSMYLFYRGSVSYAAFPSKQQVMYDAYDLGISIAAGDAGSKFGVVQIRGSAPNAMITVPYYAYQLFHMTFPGAIAFTNDYPGVVLHVPQRESHDVSFYASAGKDFMFGYLIPPAYYPA
jgi:hypothetical protein